MVFSFNVRGHFANQKQQVDKNQLRCSVRLFHIFYILQLCSVVWKSISVASFRLIFVNSQ